MKRARIAVMAPILAFSVAPHAANAIEGCAIQNPAGSVGNLSPAPLRTSCSYTATKPGGWTAYGNWTVIINRLECTPDGRVCTARTITYGGFQLRFAARPLPVRCDSAGRQR